jgi:glycerol-3-phosphate dehydrogenase (NAD(P)+)
VEKEQISILGSGSWGNTLAFLFGQNHKIILWDRNPGRVRILNKTRRFKRPIKHKYPDNVLITNDLKEALTSKIIINAISLKGMEEVFAEIAKFKIKNDIVFVNASKGIDSHNLQTPSEIIHTYLPNNPQAVISGPNLAKELIKGKPMVTEIASHDIRIAEKLQQELNNPSLRIYINDDVKGVELCAALKNVMAIAAGSADALKLGDSAKASLITRGLNEISKLLEIYGCNPKTIMGPAGIGDLIATCSSTLSRNYRVGFFLAEGKKLNDIVKNLGEVAEGINTAHAVYKICQEKNIQLPIAEQVKKLVDGEVSAVEAVINLMTRPLNNKK